MLQWFHGFSLGTRIRYQMLVYLTIFLKTSALFCCHMVKIDNISFFFFFCIYRIYMIFFAYTGYKNYKITSRKKDCLLSSNGLSHLRCEVQ